MLQGSKPLKLILPLAVLVLGIAGFSYLMASKPKTPEAKPKEKSWQVSVFQAQPQTLSPDLTLYGSVVSSSLVKAAAPGPGLVAEVRVQAGQRVSTGELLLTLDQRDFELAKAQAEADLADLQAQLADLELAHRSDQESLSKEQRLLELAQAKVSREIQLQKQKLSSESALDDAREALGRQELAVISRKNQLARYQASRQQIEARLLRQQAKLSEAELAIERSQITAAFDGVIAAVAVAAGDRVQTAQVLLSLYPGNDIEVQARIPSRYQGELQAALHAGEQLEARSSFGGTEIRLQLDRLAGEADPGGIDGYFKIEQGAAALRLGNLLKLQLRRPPQDDLIPIPFQALHGNGRIYLLDKERMQGLDVETVGLQTDTEGTSRVLIRSPKIKAGDPIIDTHLPNAASGLKVQVIEP